MTYIVYLSSETLIMDATQFADEWTIIFAATDEALGECRYAGVEMARAASYKSVTDGLEFLDWFGGALEEEPWPSREDNVQCGCGSMLPPELCHYRP